MKRTTVVGIITLIVAFACGAVPASANTPAGVDLARLKGWDIVVAEQPIASEKYAAEEFQEFFRQASGAKLPIVDKIKRPDKHIFVGSSLAMRSSNVGFSVDDFDEEDLRIVIRDGNIAITGGRPRGTLYGVYTFLEDYLGVRFLTHDHTHVPPIGEWRVVGPVDRFYHPPLAFRWSAYGETDYTIFVNPNDPRAGCNPHFAARLRCNTVNKTSNAMHGLNKDPKYGGATRRILINHSLYGQLGEEYEKDHPEYFAMVDGKRRVHHLQSQPCLTNPDVLRIVTQQALSDLKANPNRKYYPVAQNDNDNYCRCPNCAAIDKREGTHMGALLEFVNAVADEVAKKHPDVKIGTQAYWYSRKPPKNIRPRPNVQIQLCSIECSIFQPINDPSSERNAAFCKDLVEWGKICDDISIWFYNTQFGNYLLPCPNLRTLEPNIRFFVANKARGIFAQGVHNGLGAEFSDLRNYLTSRLLWDPNQSGEAIINEFLNLHYGKAAPPIRRFINFTHDDLRVRGRRIVDESSIEAGLRAFDEALSLADDDAVRARVEKASVCAYAAAIEEAWAWTEANRKDLGKIEMPPDIAQRTLPYARRLFELIDKYNVTHLTRIRPSADAMNQLRRGYGLKEH